MRAAVVGYGSIGARHARILGELGHDVVVVSRRTIDVAESYSSIETALASRGIDYVVIANQTSSHGEALRALAAVNFAGHVLVEKPILPAIEQLPALPFASLHVAYNLRFHPAIARLRDALAGGRAISVHGYVGQYLPDWRPGSDYRKSYSSRAAEGGGALRDLSHELDYLGHLFGRWRRVIALGGHLSSLEGDSDDIFALMIEFDRCPVVLVQLNYLDRFGRRELIINTDTGTLAADLIAPRAQVTIDRVAEPIAVASDDSYRAMHRAVLGGADRALLCDFDDALATLHLIEAAERSVATGQWIANHE